MIRAFSKRLKPLINSIIKYRGVILFSMLYPLLKKASHKMHLCAEMRLLFVYEYLFRVEMLGKPDEASDVLDPLEGNGKIFFVLLSSIHLSVSLHVCLHLYFSLLLYLSLHFSLSFSFSSSSLHSFLCTS